MGDESPKPASTPTGAVFLSYASQDADAAHRICDALRAANIEVWFDKSALRGGDAWDRMIRQQIRDCALFIPLISQHSQERLEGYFRLEWKLAVDRSDHMAAERSFIVPAFVARVAALLSAPASLAPANGSDPGLVNSRPAHARDRRAARIPLGLMALAVAVAGSWFALQRSSLHRQADWAVSGRFKLAVGVGFEPTEGVSLR